MVQVQAPANLDRWPHPQGRLVTLMLIRCRSRTSDACTLSLDGGVHHGLGAPYPRHLNHKMGRDSGPDRCRSPG
jgi:hypothetical protein